MATAALEVQKQQAAVDEEILRHALADSDEMEGWDAAALAANERERFQAAVNIVKDILRKTSPGPSPFNDCPGSHPSSTER